MKEVLVMKIGGKVIDDLPALQSFLTSWAKLPGKKILIHGGGKSATQVAAKLGVDAPMIQGRRITNEGMLEVAMMVYGGLVNKRIVSFLQKLDVNALGLTGADLNVIKAHKRPVKEIDYGFAGDIDAVDGDILSYLLEKGITPVMAPLTHDQQGQMLNTNADTIAATVASALSSHFSVRLMYTFEKAGVLTDAEDENSIIPELTPALYASYKADGTIADGMIPKLDNAFSALKSGVKAVYIGKQEAMHTIYQPSFSGTTICQS
ncbi:MAG: acetylglutamate kinase [Bacteroidota bacterium]